MNDPEHLLNVIKSSGVVDIMIDRIASIIDTELNDEVSDQLTNLNTMLYLLERG